MFNYHKTNMEGQIILTNMRLLEINSMASRGNSPVGGKRRGRHFQVANHTIATDDIMPILSQGEEHISSHEILDVSSGNEEAMALANPPAVKTGFESTRRSTISSGLAESDLDELFSPLHEQFSSSFSDGEDGNEDDLEFPTTSLPKRFVRQSWKNESATSELGAGIGARQDAPYPVSEQEWEPIFNNDDVVVSDNKDFWKDIESSDATDEPPCVSDAWVWNEHNMNSMPPTAEEGVDCCKVDSLEDFIDSNIVSDSNQLPATDSFQYKIKWLSFRDAEGKLSLTQGDCNNQQRVYKRRTKKRVIRRKSAVGEMFCPGVGVGEFMIL
ncbi:HBL096Wp [Eremothecium sinecaudum]|uniref:HBL096Wp n=1 Tax=Eremothecium sinecaudum TaxID=45286 RepID=A0A109UWE1_9SACH|nr:HBL096Wp [Eremothecium sinecaudum]AMD18806.1 HBL096Wp [Eremothecium sinecaudum]